MHSIGQTILQSVARFLCDSLACGNKQWRSRTGRTILGLTAACISDHRAWSLCKPLFTIYWLVACLLTCCSSFRTETANDIHHSRLRSRDLTDDDDDEDQTDTIDLSHELAVRESLTHFARGGGGGGGITSTWRQADRDADHNHSGI